MLNKGRARRANLGGTVLLTLSIAMTWVGCHGEKPSLSSPNVIGGQDVVDGYPATVGLLFRWSGYGRVFDFSLCTGTFIRDDAVLTAAHCVTPEHSYDKLLSVTMFGPGLPNNKPRLATKTIAYPGYQNGPDHDLALVFFPKGSAPAIAKIAKSEVKKGEKVSFVGFGRQYFSQNNYGTGIKRIGTNVVDSPNGLISISEGFSPHQEARPGHSVSGKGDSGGPLFDAQGHIIAIVSHTLELEQPHPQIPGRKYVDYAQMYLTSVVDAQDANFINNALAEPLVTSRESTMSQTGSWCAAHFKTCFVLCSAADKLTAKAPGYGQSKDPGGATVWCRVADDTAISTMFKTRAEDLPKALNVAL